jgi:hypothetical protein
MPWGLRRYQSHRCAERGRDRAAVDGASTRTTGHRAAVATHRNYPAQAKAQAWTGHLQECRNVSNTSPPTCQLFGVRPVSLSIAYLLTMVKWPELTPCASYPPFTMSIRKCVRHRLTFLYSTLLALGGWPTVSPVFGEGWDIRNRKSEMVLFSSVLLCVLCGELARTHRQ